MVKQGLRCGSDPKLCHDRTVRGGSFETAYLSSDWPNEAVTLPPHLSSQNPADPKASASLSFQATAGGSAELGDQRSLAEKAHRVIDWQSQHRLLVVLRLRGHANWYPVGVVPTLDGFSPGGSEHCWSGWLCSGTLGTWERAGSSSRRSGTRSAR
jgi:hypothetical protein